MRKDNLIVIFLLSYISLWVLVAFVIWGGQPEGLYWKVERYRTEIEMMDKNTQEEIQRLQTEIQVIKAKKWHK